MTKDEVIELAESVGIVFDASPLQVGSNALFAFANLVAKKEREECADWLEKQYHEVFGTAKEYAKAIRGRE